RSRDVCGDARRRLPVACRERHIGPRIGQGFGDDPAKTFRPPGHQRDPSVEPESVHDAHRGAPPVCNPRVVALISTYPRTSHLGKIRATPRLPRVSMVRTRQTLLKTPGMPIRFCHRDIAMAQAICVTYMRPG